MYQPLKIKVAKSIKNNSLFYFFDKKYDILVVEKITNKNIKKIVKKC